ncbi:MAG TPA: hypothetical protein VGL22_01340 [Terracidiphilus sp.]
MYGLGVRRFDPELKQIVWEASRALALLDAERLEELARACQALNRDHVERAEAAHQARDAAGQMAVFARVLDATRANLTVMNRLRELRQGAMFYEPLALESGPGEESGNGHD